MNGMLPHEYIGFGLAGILQAKVGLLAVIKLHITLCCKKHSIGDHEERTQFGLARGRIPESSFHYADSKAVHKIVPRKDASIRQGALCI